MNKSNVLTSTHGIPIGFRQSYGADDLYRYLKPDDVLTLLNRLPAGLCQHLRNVVFETCGGGYTYGYVHLKRLNTIVICDQSARTTLRTAAALRGRTDEFGALPNRKWPHVAVRRYLLYHTFLHELGHSLIVAPHKKRTLDKIRLEKEANAFADHWRGELYQEPFDHPDPVHNLPTPEELERLRMFWPGAMDYLDRANRLWSKGQEIRSLPEYREAIVHMKQYHGDTPIPSTDVLRAEGRIAHIFRRANSLLIKQAEQYDRFELGHKRLLEELGAELTGEIRNRRYYLLNRRMLELCKIYTGELLVSISPIHPDDFYPPLASTRYGADPDPALFPNVSDISDVLAFAKKVEACFYLEARYT